MKAADLPLVRMDAPAARVLIVDDEPLARRAVRSVIEPLPEVAAVEECGSGTEAVEAVRANPPEVMFLDIRMPDLDGFEVLEALDADHRPSVVFITAYDQHAVRAFDEQAVDYVLKPFSDERLIQATHRALEHGLEPPRARTSEGLDHHARRFVVKTRRRIYFVPLEEVDFIRASGNYAVVVAGGREHLVRTSMLRLERDLDPARFCRIHRSTIVNLDRVRELRPESSGDCVVVMKDDQRVRMSRRYRSRLGDLLM